MADVKEKKPVAPKREKQSFGERWKGIKLEMKKVVWPTKKELTSYATVVLIVTAVFTILFWGLDTGVLAALRAILGITM